MSPVWNQPSLDRLVGGVLGLVPVALHDVVALDGDLADLALLDVVAVVVDQLHLDALDRRADRADLALLVGVVEGGDRRGLATARSPRGSCSRTPSRTPRMSSPGIAEPPEQQSLSDEWSRSSRASPLSIALYIVGTPANTVTLSRSMISSALAGSKRGMNVSVAPRQRAGVHAAGLAEGVEQRQRAEHDVVVVDAEQRRATPARCLSMLSCVSSAPLGWPVVPDV